MIQVPSDPVSLLNPPVRPDLQACVVGNTLWLFGGTIEIGEREITLDDMWSLDLGKLDG
jgi:hypothetical protein